MKVTPNRIIQTGRRPQRVQIAGAFAAVLVMTAGLVATAPDVSAGAVFTVTTTADSGAGSLRDAIIAATSYGTAAIVDVAKVRQPGPMAADRWNTFEITAKGDRFTVVTADSVTGNFIYDSLLR